jgi:predicted DNA-binding transcriptional regulator AlpA
MIYLMVLGYLLIVAIEFSDLIADPLRATTLTDAEMIRLMGEIEYVRNLLAAVAAARAVTPTQAETSSEDRLLSVKEVAQTLNVSSKWVYRHAKALGIAVNRPLRFSRKAVQTFSARPKVSR